MVALELLPAISISAAAQATLAKGLGQSRLGGGPLPGKRPSRGPLPGKRPSRVAALAERVANGQKCGIRGRKRRCEHRLTAVCGVYRTGARCVVRGS